MRTDRDLIEAVRAGDRDAYGDLVQRYQAAVRRLCYGLTGNVPDAEELAHDAFVEGYLKLDQLREPDRFWPWLRIVALNLCRMWLRQSRHATVELSDAEEWVAPLEQPSDGPEARVRSGLLRLSATHRRMLVLHYWEGLSYEEIARFVEAPVGTIMSRLHRARHSLQRELESMTEEEAMNETPDDAFRREVEAEIAVLVATSRQDPAATERLSILLRRSPERLVRLIQEAEDDTALMPLAILTGRLGRPVVEAALACYGSSDPEWRRRALVLLRHALTHSASRSGGLRSARIASREAYHLLDALSAASVDDGIKAGLLVSLLEECRDETAALLLANGLLCFGEAALGRLMARFWQVPSVSQEITYALGRFGTRFLAELLEPLASGDDAEQLRALHGAEAAARALRNDAYLTRRASTGKIDPEALSDDDLALEARFRRKWAPPLKADRDPAVLQALIERLSALIADDRPPVREAAIRALGLLRAREQRDRLEESARHADPATRLTALRALADLEDPGVAPIFLIVARDGAPAERRVAIEALGQLRIAEAESLLLERLDDEDTEVRRAAVFALGHVGGEEAHAVLRDLLRSPQKALREPAARALYGGTQARKPRLPDGQPEFEWANSQQMKDRVRRGAQPPFFVALDAALRDLPEDRPYGETELTQRIAAVCLDYSSTRRYLVDEGLMRRDRGVYELTEWGRTVWRVERFIRERYGK